MNRKSRRLIVFGLLTGAAFYHYWSNRRQAEEYVEAIKETLDNGEAVNFKNFSEYLLEYHGIIAKNIFGNVVEYSSAKFNRVMTSDDIRQFGDSGYCYDMDDLDLFFSTNLELWV